MEKKEGEGGVERRVGAEGRVDVAAREREKKRKRRGHGMAASNTSGAKKRKKSRLRTRALIMFPLVKRARRSAITRFAFPTKLNT